MSGAPQAPFGMARSVSFATSQIAHARNTMNAMDAKGKSKEEKNFFIAIILLLPV